MARELGVANVDRVTEAGVRVRQAPTANPRRVRRCGAILGVGGPAGAAPKGSFERLTVMVAAGATLYLLSSLMEAFAAIGYLRACVRAAVRAALASERRLEI
ncbi:MAG: hypothetical protein RLZZ450_6882 [Pseudomonadota bacterium]|jgi:hypothetical protein